MENVSHRHIARPTLFCLLLNQAYIRKGLSVMFTFTRDCMQDTHFVYTQLPFLSRLQRPITLHKKQAVLEGLGDHALVKPVVLLPFHRKKGKEEKQLSANKDHIHRSIQPFSQNVHSDTSAAPGHETAL